jgi:hypothetical protein
MDFRDRRLARSTVKFRVERGTNASCKSLQPRPLDCARHDARCTKYCTCNKIATARPASLCPEWRLDCSTLTDFVPLA